MKLTKKTESDISESGLVHIEYAPDKSRFFRFFCKVMGVALMVMGALLAIAIPIAGIIFIALGALAFFGLSKYKDQKILSIDDPRYYAGGSTFGEWHESVHRGVSQGERFERASNQEMELLSYNDETGCGLVRGSSGKIYPLSANFCACEDFKKRGKPCKHIYFLAIKMGYSSDDFYSN